MNLKIVQKKFTYGDGEIAQCNDEITIPIIFEGPNLYCSKRYFQHPEYEYVLTTKDSNIILGDQEIAVRSSDLNDGWRTCKDQEDYHHKRCAIPLSSGGLVCDSTIKDSYFRGNVYNSLIENSIASGRNKRVSISNSTIQNSLLEFNAIELNLRNVAFNFLNWLDFTYCQAVQKNFDDKLLIGKNFENWDGNLAYTNRSSCYSHYTIGLKKCESGSGCIYESEKLEHFQEYLYK